ncbi:MAG: shikimate dehydrogenase [Lachnospiraceae bacterium]|nr:shikimate dehydrogenase [Lachnospiraceae bacterium]
MNREINGHTILTGLLGSPVSHSISPLMHNEAFRQLGLNYIYLAFDVKTDKLQTAVEGLRTLNVRGFNLTMPNKNEMCKLCDKLSPAAKISGAVNTVVNDNGILTGYTTDGIGYMQSLKEAGHNIIGKKMTLLGAGGAATAILVQAALDGVKEISVFNNRSVSFTRMEKVIDELKTVSDCEIRLYDYSDENILRREISESVLLTNGTSVGMSPNTDVSIITDISMFHKDLIVSDVIYNPRETRLLRMASEVGCPTLNGLYMLLFQGAEAFKLWTGMEMPVEVVKEKYFGV